MSDHILFWYLNKQDVFYDAFEYYTLYQDGVLPSIRWAFSLSTSYLVALSSPSLGRTWKPFSRDQSPRWSTIQVLSVRDVAQLKWLKGWTRTGALERLASVKENTYIVWTYLWR